MFSCDQCYENVSQKPFSMQKSIIRFRVRMERKKNLIIIQRDGRKTTISWKLTHKNTRRKFQLQIPQKGLEDSNQIN